MDENIRRQHHGIVMRPRTGEILAMASLPDFDPNEVPKVIRNCGVTV